MGWLQAQITVKREHAPQVELLLEQLGALSVTLVDAGDDPMYEPEPGTIPLWNATRVTGLFPLEQDAASLHTHLLRLATVGDDAIEVRILEDQDWQRAWLDRFKPMRFGQRLWVCPSGRTVPQADAIVVSLDPGLAFGTGQHPTTRLCLNWLAQTRLEDRTLVDFGCGSGILSVAAACLGASRVMALDHDPQAVIATRENAQRNSVEDRLVVSLNCGEPIACADIAVANILASILIDNSARLIAAVTNGGRLALSGILVEQIDAVTDAFDHAFDFDPPALLDGWALLTGRRRD